MNPSRAQMALNAVGILLVMFCVAASVLEVVQGRLQVSMVWLTQPGLLEAGLKTAVTGVLTVGLYAILARPAPAEERVRNDPPRR
jgi:uncharacterized MnhB-related membrane protein